MGPEIKDLIEQGQLVGMPGDWIILTVIVFLGLHWVIRKISE